MATSMTSDPDDDMNTFVGVEVDENTAFSENDLISYLAGGPAITPFDSGPVPMPRSSNYTYDDLLETLDGYPGKLAGWVWVGQLQQGAIANTNTPREVFIRGRRVPGTSTRWVIQCVATYLSAFKFDDSDDYKLEESDLQFNGRLEATLEVRDWRLIAGHGTSSSVADFVRKMLQYIKAH